MSLLFLFAALLSSVAAAAQERAPSPNETPAGRSSTTAKTPEHSAAEHTTETGRGESTHGAAGTRVQGAEHAAASVEHGEGEAEHAMPNEIWWKWANFALLAGGLGFLIKKNAGTFFAARTASIQRGIREAAEMKAEAETRAAAIEKRISNLSSEVALMRQQSKDEMAAEGKRMEDDIARQLAKVQAQAEAEIAAASKHAHAELRAHASQLALELAEQQIRQRINGDVQQVLTDRFVADLRHQGSDHDGKEVLH